VTLHSILTDTTAAMWFNTAKAPFTWLVTLWVASSPSNSLRGTRCDTCQMMSRIHRKVETDSRRKWRRCHWSRCRTTRANKWHRNTSWRTYSIRTATLCWTTSWCARSVVRSSVNTALYVRARAHWNFSTDWLTQSNRATNYSICSQRQARGCCLCTSMPSK